jgi:replication factor C subunit 1
MTPFDVTAKLFNRESNRSSSLADKLDLYFQDFSMIPLMVQENYLKMKIYLEPGNINDQKLQTLDRISRAADSISLSNLIESSQRA